MTLSYRPLSPFSTVIKGSDTFQLQRQLSNVSQNFPTASKLSNFGETFQLKKKLSNFGRIFPTSVGSFQLQSVLPNFARFFLTSLGSFQLQRNFPTSDFPTSRSFQLPFPTTRIPQFPSNFSIYSCNDVI